MDSLDEVRLIIEETGLYYSDVFNELIFKLLGKQHEEDLDMDEALKGLAALYFVGF